LNAPTALHHQWQTTTWLSTIYEGDLLKSLPRGSLAAGAAPRQSLQNGVRARQEIKTCAMHVGCVGIGELRRWKVREEPLESHLSMA
jgi:hypothetical protein